MKVVATYVPDVCMVHGITVNILVSHRANAVGALKLIRELPQGSDMATIKTLMSSNSFSEDSIPYSDRQGCGSGSGPFWSDPDP